MLIGSKEKVLTSCSICLHRHEIKLSPIIPPKQTQLSTGGYLKPLDLRFILLSKLLYSERIEETEREREGNSKPGGFLS